MTANVYVDGNDNTVKPGVTAYMTPATSWNPLDLPIFPGSNNATMTVSDTTTTIVIPLTNHIFRLVSLPGGAMTYTDGDMTVSAVDTDDDGYVNTLTYTFIDGSFDADEVYKIEDCNCYASQSTIVGDNYGPKVLSVSMKVG